MFSHSASPVVNLIHIQMELALPDLGFATDRAGGRNSLVCYGCMYYRIEPEINHDVEAMPRRHQVIYLMVRACHLVVQSQNLCSVP